MYNPFNSGSTRLTANGVVGVSGKPVRVYSVTVMSGGTAGKSALYNGTAISGTPYIWAAGTANTSQTTNFEGGVLFPSGCYADIDTVGSNTSSLLVEFSMQI